MTAKLRATQTRLLSLIDSARGFRIVLTPGKGETYGVILEETYGDRGNALASRVATASAAQTARVTDAVFAAARGSGHATSAIAFSRKKAIQLGEPEGVRLALILLTTQLIAKHERVRALVAGINSMSTEETYYWYSKCIGVDAARARRALRILLAND